MFIRLKQGLGSRLIGRGKSLAGDRMARGVSVATADAVFDAAARHQLEEMLGYERYLLRECGEVMCRELGTSSPHKISIDDDGRCGIQAEARDYMGDGGPCKKSRVS
jgi:hypothetical protein